MRRIACDARALGILLVAALGCTAGPNPTRDAADVERIVRDRLGAARAGDVTAWRRHVSDSAEWIGPGLTVASTASAQSEISANASLPAAVSTVHDMHVTVEGDWAMATYWIIDSATASGAVLGKRFRKADTYLRRAGDWQLVAAVEINVPRRAVTSITDGEYERVTGTYELDAKNILRVWRTDGHLYLGTSDSDRQELLPASASEFFTDGEPGDWVFEWDAQGRVTAMLFRLEGSADIRLRRTA